MILGTPGCWRSGSGASPRGGDGQWSVVRSPRVSDTRGGMFSRSRDHSQSAAQAAQAVQAVQAAQAATAARPLRKSELGSGSGRLGRTVHRQTDASLTGNTALWDHSHQLQNLVRETRYNTVWSIIVN